MLIYTVPLDTVTRRYSPMSSRMDHATEYTYIKATIQRANRGRSKSPSRKASRRNANSRSARPSLYLTSRRLPLSSCPPRKLSTSSQSPLNPPSSPSHLMPLPTSCLAILGPPAAPSPPAVLARPSRPSVNPRVLSRG